jgi:hypothetical protein
MRERQLELLRRDVAGIQAFLDEFEPPANGEPRTALYNDTGELVAIYNFPLPDGLDPDFVDLCLIVNDYPSRPPIGIYVLERSNRALIRQLRRIFNVMNHAAYSAPTIEGFAWICLHYDGDRWRYHPDNIARGDNLRKFVAGFYGRLVSETGGVP